LPSPPSINESFIASVAAMNSTMQQYFNNKPYPFQQQVIPSILMMMKQRIQPQPILLVQSTGGGKSAVPQTCGLTVPGVTIVLENTQALGADQSGKLINVANNNNVTFHLDPIKSTNERRYIIDTINAYIHHPIPRPPVSIFIFTSPEAIIDNVWFPTIKSIIEANVLNLFCIDEVHQFVEFGTTFRSEFCDMATMLIGPMLINASPGQNSSIHTKVPLLCMSATMNNSLFTTLQ
jgi:superfamily II DNA helicase RecQ